MNLIYCLIIWTLELVSFLINKIQVIYNSISWYHVLDDCFKTWSFIFQLLSIDSKLMISKFYFFLEFYGHTWNLFIHVTWYSKKISDLKSSLLLFIVINNWWWNYSCIFVIPILNIVGVQKLTKVHKKKIKTHDFKINYMLHYWKIVCCLVFSQFIDAKCL